MNTLIRRTDIHAPAKTNGKRHVAVDIHFTGVGLFTVPDEAEISALVEEISKQPA